MFTFYNLFPVYLLSHYCLVKELVWTVQKNSASVFVRLIDLVLIDPQSVGKRTYNLMDTVNAKKDGRPFAGVSINI
jgi:hypothetical protein